MFPIAVELFSPIKCTAIYFYTILIGLQRLGGFGKSGKFFYFIPHLLWQIEENVFFNVALLKSGLAGNRECAQHVLPRRPSDPGSSSWQCPVLGSAEEGFLLQAGHSLAVCCSCLLFMAAQMWWWIAQGVPFLRFFGHVRCRHPLVSLGLSALISSMSLLVGCFGFSIVVHLRIPSSFHVNCCTSFSHCCLCLEQQCFPQALTILSLISLKWWHF